MKKKIIIPIAIVVVLVTVLFLPIPRGAYDDGGTREYQALTYKIVAWKRINSEIDENGETVHRTYEKNSVFWYPDNFRDIDDLWKMETDSMISWVAPIEQLKNKYPEYFDLGTFKGLEVYIWQTSSGRYACGVLTGTNRNKTDEEIAALAQNGATVEEMKEILSYYDIDREDVVIIPVKNPESNYEIDVSMFETAKEVFWG